MKEPTIILTQCVYDVDNHYVHLSIRDAYDDGKAFLLILNESRDDTDDNTIDMYLTREDLQFIIDQLTHFGAAHKIYERMQMIAEMAFHDGQQDIKQKVKNL